MLISAGCGAVIEDLPYLEISCASDVQGLTPDGSTVEGAYNGESSATGTPDSYEKQESLIPLAWSKPTDCDTDCQVDAANVGSGQSPDVQGSEMTPILPAQSRKAVPQIDVEEQKSTLAQCVSAQSAEQATTEEQVAHQCTGLFLFYFISSNFFIVSKRDKRQIKQSREKTHLKKTRK